jgi:hypothetical protein
MTTTISQSTGWLSPAFKQAYGGEVPTETFVANPAGDGAVLTATFAQPGEVASYAQLRNGIRYGWPAAFALGWLGGYLAWVYIGKRQERKKGTYGLMGTPAQHAEMANQLLRESDELEHNGDLFAAYERATQAMQESRWVSGQSLPRKALARHHRIKTKVVARLLAR